MAGADAVLALAAELERRDGAVAARLARVLELAGQAERIGERAAELHALLEDAPARLAQLDAESASARDALRAADAAVEAARRRADEAARRGREEARREAALELGRAEERARDAAAHLGRVEASAARLRSERASAHEEARLLVDEAGSTAASVARLEGVSASGRDGPGERLDDLPAWAGRVRAALFVVRGQLEGERERVVREANELGASVLGEPVAGASVALVRRRLEQTLGA